MERTVRASWSAGVLRHGLTRGIKASCGLSSCFVHLSCYGEKKAVTCLRVASCIVGNSVSVPGIFFFQWRKGYYTENNSFLTVDSTVSGGSLSFV